MHTNGAINKRIAVFGLSAFFIYVILVLLPTRAPAPPGPPPTPVTVVNTTANPVPVVADNPVPVRIAALEPFQQELSFDIEDGALAANATFTVPQGKLLVIESISAFFNGPTGQHSIGAGIVAHTSSADIVGESFDVAFTFLGTPNGDYYVSPAQLIRAYCGPGTPLIAVLRRDASTGSAFCRFTVSGYYLNVP